MLRCSDKTVRWIKIYLNSKIKDKLVMSDDIFSKKVSFEITSNQQTA